MKERKRLMRTILDGCLPWLPPLFLKTSLDLRTDIDVNLDEAEESKHMHEPFQVPTFLDLLILFNSSTYTSCILQKYRSQQHDLVTSQSKSNNHYHSYLLESSSKRMLIEIQ